MNYRVPPFADSPSFFQTLWRTSNDYLHFLFDAWNLKGKMEISFAVNIIFTVLDIFPVKCSGMFCAVLALLPFPLCSYIILKAASPHALLLEWNISAVNEKFVWLTTQAYYLHSATKSSPVTFVVVCQAAVHPRPSQIDDVSGETQYLEVACSIFCSILFGMLSKLLLDQCLHLCLDFSFISRQLIRLTLGAFSPLLYSEANHISPKEQFLCSCCFIWYC